MSDERRFLERVQHVYEVADGLVRRMEIRRSSGAT